MPQYKIINYMIYIINQELKLLATNQGVRSSNLFGRTKQNKQLGEYLSSCFFFVWGLLGDF